MTLEASGEVTHRMTGPDIVLSDEDKLEGTVRLASGHAAVGVDVCIRGAARQEIRTATDATGRFSVGPIRGGVYAAEFGGRVYVVRAWQAGTAPPAATNDAMFVLEDITRGQSPTGQLPGGEFFHSNRFLLAATITSAIVVPIAVYANRHDGQPGS